MTHLVLVESFAKAKVIAQYLNTSKRLQGKKFEVIATLGHVRDLGAKALSIEISKGFKPIYEVLPYKKKLVQQLVNKTKTAEALWLASDYDREGESIAMHLKVLLKPKCPCYRVVFTEITSDAIVDAFLSPREIDYNLVNAQETRRILDRLVGYKISPLLWREFRGIKGLSAGRVQSSGLYLVFEREQEIADFKTSKQSWEVTADFTGNPGEKTLLGKLNKTFKHKADVETFLKSLRFDFNILDRTSCKKYTSPSKPFKTSSLQQSAYTKYGFTANKTMSLAQELYEKGLITYMRTESTVLCQSFVEDAQSYIKSKYGEKYIKQNIKGVQKGAHEAIRPTAIRPVIENIGGDTRKLFDMIYQRAMESVMSDEERQVITYKISDAASNDDIYFICTDSCVTFMGFNIISSSPEDKPTNIDYIDSVVCRQVVAKQKWKEPPSHYTEASFIKRLEHEGIGRPSTYASTVAKLLDRGYISIVNKEGERVIECYLTRKKGHKTLIEHEKNVLIGKEKNVIVITDIGNKVNEFVASKFDYICDRKFTAHMETDLDKIADGSKKHLEVIESFWKVFSKSIMA